MTSKDLIRERQTRMESARSSYERQWADIAALVYPEMDAFHGRRMTVWGRSNGYAAPQMHDPYAALALDDGVSVFEGFVMPRGQRWQKLRLPDELMESVANRQWLEKLESRLFQMRHDPDAGFGNAIHQSAMSLYAFAAQSMWIDVRRDAYGRPQGLSYQSEFIGEIYRQTDGDDNSTVLHRKFGLTAEQALSRWGDESPKAVKEAMKGENPNRTQQFEFVHFIERNPDFDPERMDAKGMLWRAGYYLCGGDDEVFKEGGYRSLPRIFSTFSPSARGDWGYCPTMRVLPQIKLLQQIEGDRLLGAELRLLPPLLTKDDELDGAIVELYAHGITNGGIDERGNPTVRTYLEDADATDAALIASEARAMIDKAYGRDLLQLNRELKTHITATRTQQEMAEKGILLAPLARQEGEWLSPMTQRELALMAEIGLMDDAPPQVLAYLADNGGFDFKYDNQLSRMMMANETASFLTFAEQVGAMAQFDQSGKTLDDFQTMYPNERVMPQLARNAGVPASMQATEEELAAKKKEKAVEQQRQLALESVPVIADAAKNVAAMGGANGG